MLGTAQASPPRECRTLAAHEVNPWERAKTPLLGRYCDQLALGSGRLVQAPNVALALADDAEKTLPGRAAPLVLRGRALARSSRYAEAVSAFEGAEKRDASALDDASALFAYGRALARAGKAPQASQVFVRALALGSTMQGRERGTLLTASGLRLLSDGASIERARAVLLEAVTVALESTRTLAGLGLAVAMIRSGEEPTLEGDPRDPIAVMSESETNELLLDAAATGEKEALFAVAYERKRELDKAREAWERVAAKGGPFAGGASERAKALRSPKKR